MASGSLLVLSARGSYDSDPALVTKFRLVAATFDEVILVYAAYSSTTVTYMTATTATAATATTTATATAATAATANAKANNPNPK